MLEQQLESDEDCEVYFLKPVNEYNIVEKIKEANKELFAETDLEPQTVNNNIQITESIKNVCITTMRATATTTIRKVTFAPNLEDYEPESPTKEKENEVDSPELKRKIKTAIDKFPTIEEKEEQIVTMQQQEETFTSDKNLIMVIQIEEQQTNEVKKEKENLDKENKINDAEEDELDDICEEINIMEMDESGSTATTTTTKGIKTTSITEVSPLLKEDCRLMVKQTTFDFDKQDSKSLTNLLTASDCEEENDFSGAYEKDDNDFNDASIFVGIDDLNDEDDDDDDKLSLIVASYLPNDFERTVAMTPSPSLTASTSASSNTLSNSNGISNYFYFQRSSGKSTNSSSLSSSTKALKPSLSSSFGRRFQLRRKAHSTNSIGAICSGPLNVNHSSKPELTNLKLNYKICCEYRNCLQGKLPKYTGYLSEYGLSREQLQQREQQLQKKQRFVLEHTLRANEEEISKMQDNERAFTTWLKNKMRFPINKTRNMFDVKLRLNGKTKTKITNTTAARATETSLLTNPTSATKNKPNRGPFGCTTSRECN